MNNTENQIISVEDEKTVDKHGGFDISDEGQNLGGGKGKTGIAQTPGDNQHPLGNDTGQFNSEGEFSKTDQSIAQVAPGQTTTYTDQGGG